MNHKPFAPTLLESNTAPKTRLLWRTNLENGPHDSSNVGATILFAKSSKLGDGSVTRWVYDQPAPSPQIHHFEHHIFRKINHKPFAPTLLELTMVAKTHLLCRNNLENGPHDSSKVGATILFAKSSKLGEGSTTSQLRAEAHCSQSFSFFFRKNPKKIMMFNFGGV